MYYAVPVYKRDRTLLDVAVWLGYPTKDDYIRSCGNTSQDVRQRLTRRQEAWRKEHKHAVD